MMFHSIDKIMEVIKEEKHPRWFGVANSLKFLVKWKYRNADLLANTRT